MKLRNRLILFASLLVLALIVTFLPIGCTKETTKIQSPTDPTPICLPPDALAASVEPSASGCSLGDDGRCIAVFGISSPEVVRAIWTFPAALKSSVSGLSGDLAFPTPDDFPHTFSGSVTGCTCTRVNDPDGSSCRTEEISVTFEGP